MKVADIAIHLLDAIEAGERKLAEQDAPLARETPAVLSPFASMAASSAASAPSAVATIDNLKLVVGIGPKNEEVLVAAGITTFELLAALTVQQIQDILPDTQDARVAREDWIGQATKFAEAKANGVDPATIAEGNQVT